MNPRIHPADEARIRRDFNIAVNMSVQALTRWLETDESKSVGYTHRGESESVGHKSGRRIVTLLKTPAHDLTESDYVHMRKVAGYAKRHRAQRPAGDVSKTRWRYSLMNWGHDPLR